MTNSMELAVELAKIKLPYEFNDKNLIEAFEGDGCKGTFGEALGLLCPSFGYSAVWLLQTFDRAGMTKDEMAEAIWSAAEHYYDSKLANKEDER